MLLWQLISIQVVTFGLLVLLMRHLSYRQVTQVRNRLEQLYDENLKHEEELKKGREGTQQLLKDEMNQHDEDVMRLKGEVELEIQRMRDEAKAKAQEESERIIAEARARGERMQARLMMEAEEKALELASEILRHLFSSHVVMGLHHHLIEGLIEEIEKLDGQRIKTNVETIEVRIPFSLTPAQRENLTRILSSKTGRLVNIKESIDPEILAGMVVCLNDLVLDGGLNNKLRETLAHVREAISR